MAGDYALLATPFGGATSNYGLEVNLKGYFTEIGGSRVGDEIVEQQESSPRAPRNRSSERFRDSLKWGDIRSSAASPPPRHVEVAEARRAGNVEKARSNATITMYDQGHSAVAEWTLEKAWPLKVSGPQLSSDGSAIGIEEMTMVCESFIRTK